MSFPLRPSATCSSSLFGSRSGIRSGRTRRLAAPPATRRPAPQNRRASISRLRFSRRSRGIRTPATSASHSDGALPLERYCYRKRISMLCTCLVLYTLGTMRSCQHVSLTGKAPKIRISSDCWPDWEGERHSQFARRQIRRIRTLGRSTS